MIAVHVHLHTATFNKKLSTRVHSPSLCSCTDCCFLSAEARPSKQAMRTAAQLTLYSLHYSFCWCVHTLSINNSYFLFSLLQITVLLQHICFRTFRAQVNVKTSCDACAVAGYALCWYAAADSNSAEHCKLCTETTATYCNQRAACAMHLAGCRPTIYLPGTTWYQPTPNLECRHILMQIHLE